MADEITISASLKVVNGNASSNLVYSNLKFDQAAAGGPTPVYWKVGSGAEESQAFTELTNEGWLIMKNTDSTNYVQWGFSTGVYGGRLEADEIAMFRCEPGLTLYMLANTAECKVEVYCFED